MLAWCLDTDISCNFISQSYVLPIFIVSLFFKSITYNPYSLFLSLWLIYNNKYGSFGLLTSHILY